MRCVILNIGIKVVIRNNNGSFHSDTLDQGTSNVNPTNKITFPAIYLVRS